MGTALHKNLHFICKLCSVHRVFSNDKSDRINPETGPRNNRNCAIELSNTIYHLQRRVFKLDALFITDLPRSYDNRSLVILEHSNTSLSDSISLTDPVLTMLPPKLMFLGINFNVIVHFYYVNKRSREIYSKESVAKGKCVRACVRACVRVSV